MKIKSIYSSQPQWFHNFYHASFQNSNISNSNCFWHPQGIVQVVSLHFLDVIQVSSRYFHWKTLKSRKQKTVCHCPGRRPCVWPAPSRRPNHQRIAESCFVSPTTSSSASLFVLSFVVDVFMDGIIATKYSFLSLLLLLLVCSLFAFFRGWIVSKLETDWVK